jgi:chromosome segregation ATPase
MKLQPTIIHSEYGVPILSKLNATREHLLEELHANDDFNTLINSYVLANTSDYNLSYEKDHNGNPRLSILRLDGSRMVIPNQVLCKKLGLDTVKIIRELIDPTLTATESPAPLSTRVNISRNPGHAEANLYPKDAAQRCSSCEGLCEIIYRQSDTIQKLRNKQVPQVPLHASSLSNVSIHQNEIEKLKEQIQHLEGTINILNERLDDTDVLMELNEANSEIDNLDETIIDLEAQIGELKESLQKKSDDLSEALDSSQEQNQKLKTQIDKLRTELRQSSEVAQKTYINLKAAQELEQELQQKLDNANSDKQKYLASISTLEEQKAQILTLHAKLSNQQMEETVCLRATNQELLDALSLLERNLEETRAQSLDQTSQLHNQLKDLTIALSAAKNDCSELQEKLSVADAELLRTKTLQTDLEHNFQKEKNASITSITLLNEKIQELLGDQNKTASALKTRDQNLASANHRIEALSQKITEIIRSQEQTTLALAQSQTAKNDLQEQLDQANETITQQKKDSIAQLDALKAEIKQLKKTNHDGKTYIQAKLAALQSEFTAATAALNVKSSEKQSELEHIISEQVNVIQQTTNDLHAAGVQVNELNETIRSQIGQIESLTQGGKQFQQSFTQLQQLQASTTEHLQAVSVEFAQTKVQFQKENKALIEERQALASKLTSTQDQLEQMQQKLDTQERSVVDISDLFKCSQDDLKQARDQLKKASSDNEELRQHIQIREQDIAEKGEAIERLEMEAEKQIDAFNQAFREQQSELVRLQALARSKEGPIRAAEKRIKELEANLNAQRITNSEVNEILQTKTSQEKEIRAELRRLTAQVELGQKEKDDLLIQLNTKERALIQALDQVKTIPRLQQENQFLSVELHKAIEQSTVLEKTHAIKSKQLNQRNKDLFRKIEEQADQITRLEDSLIEISSIEEGHKQKLAQLQTLEARNATLEALSAAQKAEIIALKAEIERLKNLLNANEGLKIELESELMRQRERMHQAQIEAGLVPKLEAELFKALKSISHLDSQVQSMELAKIHAEASLTLLKEQAEGSHTSSSEARQKKEPSLTTEINAALNALQQTEKIRNKFNQLIDLRQMNPAAKRALQLSQDLVRIEKVTIGKNSTNIRVHFAPQQAPTEHFTDQEGTLIFRTEEMGIYGKTITTDNGDKLIAQSLYEHVKKIGGKSLFNNMTREGTLYWYLLNNLSRKVVVEKEKKNYLAQLNNFPLHFPLISDFLIKLNSKLNEVEMTAIQENRRNNQNISMISDEKNHQMIDVCADTFSELLILSGNNKAKRPYVLGELIHLGYLLDQIVEKDDTETSKKYRSLYKTIHPLLKEMLLGLDLEKSTGQGARAASAVSSFNGDVS